MNTGKLVILGMLAVTLALAIFAVWYRHRAGRRTRQLFGTEHALRIQHAEQVELRRLTPPAGTPEQLQAEAVAPGRPVGRVSGMTHVRGALLEDRSFQWSAPAPDCRPQWQYLLRFHDDSGETRIAVDLACRRLRLLGPGGGEASFAPMGTFLERFLTSQFAESPPAESPGR